MDLNLMPTDPVHFIGTWSSNRGL